MLRITGTAELQAAALLYKQAPAETRRAVRDEAAKWAPTLVRAAVARAPGPVERQIAASGRTKVSTNGLMAVFGATGRLSSGAPLREVAGAYEFGSSQQGRKKKYLSRRSGKAVTINRRTKAQIPADNPDGRFIHAAVADTTPDLVGRYVRAIAQAVTHGG